MPTLFLSAVALLAGGISLRDVDPDFRPVVAAPRFVADSGPRVLIDAGHHNFHTADGRFRPLAELLRADGFRVDGHTEPFDAASCATADVLVISNALHADNVERWSEPTPSAFTADEITALRAWVERGGRLLLIADHVPFGGAAAELAAAFGVQMSNGYALGPEQDRPSIDRFTRDGGSLSDHPAAIADAPNEAVASVATFSGQAFPPAEHLHPLLVFPAGAQLVRSTVANELGPEVPREDASGWWQGAVGQFGAGRAAFFGEAALFSAQRVGLGKRKLGMNHPAARENAQFVLNLFHWLAEADAR